MTSQLININEIRFAIKKRNTIKSFRWISIQTRRFVKFVQVDVNVYIISILKKYQIINCIIKSNSLGNWKQRIWINCYALNRNLLRIINKKFSSTCLLSNENWFSLCSFIKPISRYALYDCLPLCGNMCYIGAAIKIIATHADTNDTVKIMNFFIKRENATECCNFSFSLAGESEKC